MESASNCGSAAAGRGGTARRAGTVRGGGSDRGAALRGGSGGRHGLAADRAALRRTRTAAALSDRVAQSGCGRGDGRGPAAGARANRPVGGDGRTRRLPSAARHARGSFAAVGQVSRCGGQLRASPCAREQQEWAAVSGATTARDGGTRCLTCFCPDPGTPAFFWIFLAFFGLFLAAFPRPS